MQEYLDENEACFLVSIMGDMGTLPDSFPAYVDLVMHKITHGGWDWVNACVLPGGQWPVDVVLVIFVVWSDARGCRLTLSLADAARPQILHFTFGPHDELETPAVAFVEGLRAHLLLTLKTRVDYRLRHVVNAVTQRLNDDKRHSEPVPDGVPQQHEVLGVRVCDTRVPTFDTADRGYFAEN